MTFFQDANYPTALFGSTRTWDAWDIAWDALERSRGVYDWSALDARLALAQQHGVDVLFTFGRTPAWAVAGSCTGNYTPAGCAEPPANLQDWDDFVRAIVTHSAGRIHYWEIWNEPNDSGSYAGDVSTLVTLARRAYSIIKSSDPSAVVLTPSSTGGNDVGTSYMDQYLAAGGGAYADIVAFHGYWGSSSDLTPEHIVSLVESYRQVLAKHGLQDKPLWDTEASWGNIPNVDQDAGAAFLARHYLLHWSEHVQRFYWYAWDSSDWGTLWSPKNGINAAGIAYREISRWMTGATLTAPCSQVSTSVWRCTFTRAGGYQAEAVWSTEGNMSYTAAAQYRQYRDLAGAVNPISGSLTVTIGNKPILLETNSVF